jgi:Transposase IS66 family/IS66 C-terminal element
MSGKKKNKKTSGFDLSNPDSLHGLNEETFIGIICALYNQNRQLSEILQTMVREKHGPKTERFIDSGQLTLFDADADVSKNEDISAKSTEPKRDSRNERKDRNPRPNNIQRIRIRIREHCAKDLICSCCGKQKVKVNEIVVHSRHGYAPARAFIEELFEDVFACPECCSEVVLAAESVETATSVQDVSTDEADRMAELSRWFEPKSSDSLLQESPAQILDDAVATARSQMRRSVAQISRVQASPAMLSYIAISKYCDHLPLYRLEEIFARNGASIARSTMCGWLVALVSLFRPLYDLMHQKLLTCKVVWTDDTPVKVQVRKLKKNIKTGRIWVYTGDETNPFNVFHYTSGRAREGPRQFLRGFKRYLQGDCFSGNEAICAETGATLVACNAHSRRYFVKALLNYKAKSEEALRYFQRLFEIEKTVKELGLTSDDIKRMREQEAKPIWDEFKIWLDNARLIAVPKSSFGKAVGYCLNNWDALTAYMKDGDLSMDNNAAEREMKRVAIGRKAWMFFGSDHGGETAEVLLSIVSTCRRHHVEPFAYIRGVIEQLIRDPDTDLETLLPHTWNQKKSKAEIAA